MKLLGTTAQTNEALGSLLHPNDIARETSISPLVRRGMRFLETPFLLLYRKVLGIRVEVAQGESLKSSHGAVQNMLALCSRRARLG
jgi:hypothetical protein